MIDCNVIKILQIDTYGTKLKHDCLTIKYTIVNINLGTYSQYTVFKKN